MTKDEAESRIRALGEPYKLEILQGIVEKDPSAPITIYHIGEPGHPEVRVGGELVGSERGCQHIEAV